MLRRTASPVCCFADSRSPPGEYKLCDVSLEIPDSQTAVFSAKLLGPLGSPVWARAWLWNEIDKTVAEAVSSQLTAGDDVTLTVRLHRDCTPDHASMRIESAPLRTEHVVSVELP